MVLCEIDFLGTFCASIQSDTSSDQWPVFTLKSVKVVCQATGQLVSLFASHGGFLVRVEGLLDVDDDYTSLGELL